MRPGGTVLGAAMTWLGAVCWLEAADDPPLRSLFDGRTLAGWVREHTDRFTVRDGLIVNEGGAGWLRSEKSYRDFEFLAEYRVIRPGSDSGIFFRASVTSADREPHWPTRGYQLQVIDGDSLGMLFGHGLAPPRFERKAEALKSAIRDPKDWQKIRLKVVGPRAEVAVNDVVVTTSEAIQSPEGHIGLQGENGHLEWRGLRIREFASRSRP